MLFVTHSIGVGFFWWKLKRDDERGNFKKYLQQIPTINFIQLFVRMHAICVKYAGEECGRYT